MSSSSGSPPPTYAAAPNEPPAQPDLALDYRNDVDAPLNDASDPGQDRANIHDHEHGHGCGHSHGYLDVPENLARASPDAQVLHGVHVQDPVRVPRAPASSSTHAAQDNLVAPDAIPDCPICLDKIPVEDSFTIESCCHVFCKPCIRKHVYVLANENTRYPLPCPQCNGPLDDSVCLSLVDEYEETYDKLTRMIIEKGFCSQLRYCANEECGEPFDWDHNADTVGTPLEFRVECPICQVATCVNCRQRWHEGKTCEEHLGDGEDNDVIDLGRRLGWMRCPRCGVLVDRRQGDCHFVRCRCGCGFCHNCGVEYQSTEPAQGNAHGTPGCECGLFGEDYQALENPIRLQLVQRLRELNEGLDRLIVRPQPGPRARLEGVDMRRGPNGLLALDTWIGGWRHRRKLAPKMLADLRAFRCPYDACGRQFDSLRALEQHLLSVRRHDVWLCCGRPFYTARSKERHVAAVHGLHQA